MKKRNIFFTFCGVIFLSFAFVLKPLPSNVCDSPELSVEEDYGAFIPVPGGTEDNVIDWLIMKYFTGSEKVYVGDTVNYEILVTNNDTVPIDSIVITDFIPVGMSLVDNDWTMGVGQEAQILLQGGALSGTVLLPNTTTVQNISLVVEQPIGLDEDDWELLEYINRVILSKGVIYGEDGEPIEVENLNEENNEAYSEAVTLYNLPSAKTDIIDQTVINHDVECIAIYPNPVINRLNVGLKSTKETDVVLKLIDITGNEALVKRCKIDPGLNEVKVDMNGIPAGVYYIHIIQDGYSIIEKVVKH